MQIKNPKAAETNALTLFIQPSSVIEHIISIHNRQGEFRGGKAENQLEKEGKAKQHQPTGGRLEYGF